MPQENGQAVADACVTVCLTDVWCVYILKNKRRNLVETI